MELSNIGNLIYFIRGQRVMLDSDLAALYKVPTKYLNLAVKRNTSRFPIDFMFTLTQDEAAALRFQIETSKKGRGGRRYLPRVFTEHGVAMLSSVLNSKRAVRVNIEIVRTFIRLRHTLISNRRIAKRLERVENNLKNHEIILGKHTAQIQEVFEDIRRLMDPPIPTRKRIGFLSPKT